MTARPTYQDCAAAGMTMAQAAEAMGVTPNAVMFYAQRHGLRFRPARPNRAPNGLIDRLTESERADYVLLRKKGKLGLAEALRAIRRADLAEGLS